VQVVDKGRPRDNLQKTNKYQLMILQDEEETQVQGIMYGIDIKSYAELLIPYHTYLISVASVTESNHAYGIPINTFHWTIDKGTLIEPIEDIDPPEGSLPPSTRLTLTMFDSFHHQPEGLEFDVLATVVNVALPTRATNGSRIQELIIMDNLINKQVCHNNSSQSSIPTGCCTENGSLQLIPFEDEIISIADAHQHLSPIQHANKSLLGFIHGGDSIVQLAVVPQILFQDNSGSATALIADQAAETMLHLTSKEIYDIRCTKKQMLPLANVTRQLTGKTFTIQVKKSFAKTMDGTPAKLIILSYAEKENIISAPSSPAPMDTRSSKRKTEKDKEKVTSHRRHAPENQNSPSKTL
ncbi:hypothetical protein KY290_026551, partial [Solanum tuberosum]